MCGFRGYRRVAASCLHPGPRGSTVVHPSTEAECSLAPPELRSPAYSYGADCTPWNARDEAICRFVMRGSGVRIPSAAPPLHNAHRARRSFVFGHIWRLLRAPPRVPLGGPQRAVVTRWLQVRRLQWMVSTAARFQASGAGQRPARAGSKRALIGALRLCAFGCRLSRGAGLQPRPLWPGHSWPGFRPLRQHVLAVPSSASDDSSRRSSQECARGE